MRAHMCVTSLNRHIYCVDITLTHVFRDLDNVWPHSARLASKVL